jgi:hypothetical protein
MTRSRWAAVIAPLTAPLTYGAAAFVVFTFPYDKERTATAWFLPLLFYVPASYLVSFAFGIPLTRMLRNSGRLSFWWMTLLAIPLGATAFVLFQVLIVLTDGSVTWSKSAPFIAIGGLVGYVAAAVYCMLAGITASSRGRAEQIVPAE